MTIVRHVVLAGLLAGVCANASCGLLRLPERVVGGLARATIQGGKKIHQKSADAIARRKQAKADKEAKPEDTQAGGAEATAGAAGAAAPPANGGLLPDLPHEGGPAAEGSPGASPVPSADPYAVPEALPPLPEL